MDKNDQSHRLCHLGHKFKCIKDFERKIEIEKDDEGNVMIFFLRFSSIF